MTVPTIAHLLPAYNAFPPVIPAGTELRVEQAGLRHKRYQPLVICGHFEGQAEQEKMGAMEIRRIRFHPVYRRLFQKITRLDPIPYGERMWRIIEEVGASLIHIHNEPKLLAGLAKRLQQKPMPVIAHIANQKPFRPEDIPLVTRFVACSHYMAGWLAETYQVPKEKISVIYTGVNVAEHQPIWAIPKEDRKALRHRFGIKNDDAIVFIFGGRLVKEKGVAELLDAFIKVRAESPVPVHLLIAGNVNESRDPENVKAVYGRAMAKRMADMPDLTWVGSLKPSEMHEFLLAGDIFMLPSLWDDPYPTVMLEAAAAGLPIIAGARGGITEFLKDCPAFDFVEDPANPDLLAAAMKRFASSPQDCETAGRWLRGIIESHYDWSRVAADFEILYDCLLSPAP